MSFYCRISRNEMLFLRPSRAFSSNFGKRPLGKIGEKLINLTAKLGEINDIKHNMGSKLYPQNYVILDCIMLTIPLKHTCLSIILIWSLFLMSKTSKKKHFLLFLIGKKPTWYWKKGGYFRLGMGPKFGP